MGTVIVLSLLLLIIAAAVRSVVKKTRAGCSGNCAMCGSEKRERKK